MSSSSSKRPTAKALREAAELNEAALQLYAEWEIDDAIIGFEKAIQRDPDNSDYHLNLARAHARASRFHNAMESLGAFLRTATDEALTERFEHMFSSAMDDVESQMIEQMRADGATVQAIGKAIQMWLEYRISIGRRALDQREPGAWSAALHYAVQKVNLEEVKAQKLATLYNAKERTLKKRYDDLVATLDLMPGDYRYFIGQENPLDKLADAAQALDEIYSRFRDE